jgi:hypothetical protein
MEEPSLVFTYCALASMSFFYGCLLKIIKIVLKEEKFEDLEDLLMVGLILSSFDTLRVLFVNHILLASIIIKNTVLYYL